MNLIMYGEKLYLHPNFKKIKMKKNLILLLLLFVCISGFSQDNSDPFPQDVDKKHEITANALTLIVSEWLDFSYEYLINEESSFGVDLQFGLDSNDDFDSYRTFSITPNYRRYFSNKYARGFFVEAFGDIEMSMCSFEIRHPVVQHRQVEIHDSPEHGVAILGKTLQRLVEVLDGQRVFVPVQGHAEAVTDADDVDPRTLSPSRAHGLAHGHHDQPLARGFLRGEVRDCKFGSA